MTCSHDTIRVVANIFISFIGAGVLGLPYAFKQAGLLEGALVMTFVAYFSVKAMLLLIDCKYKVLSVLGSGAGCLTNIKVKEGKSYTPLKTDEVDEEDDSDDNGKSASKKSSRSNSPNIEMVSKEGISYSDVVSSAFGPVGRLVLDVTLVVSQIGFCCGYLIYIIENVLTYFPMATKSKILGMILPMLFFLTLIPDLAKLAVVSMLAQTANIVAFTTVFWFDVEHLYLAHPSNLKEFSAVGMPMFFSVAVYCYEGAGMILSLEQSVPNHLKSSFRSHFINTLGGVTLLYVMFGVCGYLSFGGETRDLITLNLPKGEGIDFAMLVKGCLGIALFFTYPVMMFPVTTLLKQRLTNMIGCAKLAQIKVPLPYCNEICLFGICLRLVLVTLTGMIVVGIHNFSDLMALIGATCCTTLAFIMPGACHWMLFNSELSRGQLLLDAFLVIFGLVFAIVGLTDALKNYVHHNA